MSRPSTPRVRLSPMPWKDLPPVTEESVSIPSTLDPNHAISRRLVRSRGGTDARPIRTLGSDLGRDAWKLRRPKKTT